MKCSTLPNVEATSNCSHCGSALCVECDANEAGDVSICIRCVALAAVSDFGVKEQEREKRVKDQESVKEGKGKQTVKIQYAILALAVIVVPLQLFSMVAGPELSPIDLNDPEEVTDECILNLFVISDMLQLGELPANDFKCPATNDPYIVIQTADDIIVRDPHPELHGFVEMSVSQNNPFPELVE